jgi:DNA mismatch repair protein MutS
MQASTLERLPNTPMWVQYAAIKKDALDALLFYRMGDFYELFLDDAVEAAGILGITLTARNKGEEIPIPMCGVPFHSSATYINRLLRAGKRVAICEQTEAAGTTKGIVKREIVRIVSPGMVFDSDTLDAEQSNYFIALSLSEGFTSGHFCQADVTTGAIEYAAFANADQLRDELSLLQAKEIIAPASLVETKPWNDFVSAVGKEFFPCVTPVPDYYFSAKSAFEDLCRHYDVLNLEGFGLNPTHPSLPAVGAAFRRIRDTQKLAGLQHLQTPAPKSIQGYVQLDESTIEHLDIFPKPGQNPEDSAYHHLNRCSTAMGARKLREIMARPLAELSAIQERQDAIQDLVENPTLLRRIRDQLGGMRDIERLVSKVGLHTANPRDIQAMGEIFSRLPTLKLGMGELVKSSLLRHLEKEIKDFRELHQYLNTRLLEDAPTITREGNIFKQGWHAELDELIALTEDGKSFLSAMEQREKESTGIQSLKIKYNKVFGYFIEVTSSNLASVPKHYIRKQTTANGERFLTDELKKFEDKILSAQEKRIALEEHLFNEVLGQIAKESLQILSTAKHLATLDVLTSMATVALEHGYVRPEIIQESLLEIDGGRHPALEHLVGTDKFIPNSVFFSSKEKIFLITGPNMAGKSTYMRQVALITLMAQTGSFVPAKRARIGLVDRIATRVGASDRIGRGQSTFMVEMNEMARILRQSSERSLLIIDEIGRGTSTFDGLALAQSILEDLSERLRCRTLFATHYHELTSLEDHFDNVKNLSVAVEEREGQVVFLHEVRAGKASGSYGIEVARLAGLPISVVERAKSILGGLEKGGLKLQKAQKSTLNRDRQLSFFSSPQSPIPAAIAPPPAHLLHLEQSVRSINLDQCTPFEALVRLKGLKDSLIQPDQRGS